MRIRFRVCTECGARRSPKDGRYCYVKPVPGHKAWDFVCNDCRSRLATGRHRAESPPPEPESPPAGWYRDPDGVAAERWWDGTDWTDHAR